MFSNNLKRKLEDIRNPHSVKEHKTKNDNESEELSYSLLTNLSQYFKDALVENEEDIFDSEDVFADSYNDANMEMDIKNKEKSHVSSVTPSVLVDEKIFDDKIEPKGVENLKKENNRITSKCAEQFSDLKNMYDKNKEESVLNETSIVKDVLNIGESSQYRKEISDAFNVCEITICHLNDDFLNDANNSTFMKNSSIWERSDVRNLEFNKEDKSFADNLPQNISKLLSGEINNENTSAVNNSSTANLSLAPVKFKKTPLDVKEFSRDFYGLPPLTKSLIEQYKGISELYGNSAVQYNNNQF